MRFVADDQSLISEERLARAYVAGPDEAPTFGRTLMSGDQIVVERSEDASGSFSIPWPIPDHGDWLLATTSLMERERPYHLEVELARGLVFRLRDQLAAWETLGLRTTEKLLQGVRDATRSFSRAAVSQTVDPASAAVRARTALKIAADTACLLADLYSEQALSIRMPEGQRLTTLLGVRLNDKAPRGAKAKTISETFNLAAISCGWGVVEPSEGRRDWTATDKLIDWARSTGMRTCLGPLLEFDEKRLPDWAYLWEGDVETLTSLMLGHIRTVVQRYRGKVQLWNVASKINRDRILSLTDEQRLQIVASAVRLVRQLDPSTPVVVGVEQPWGEYRAKRQTELAPIDFADALERADLGIAGFELEMNIGYRPFGSELRNPLAMSRLVDLWNLRLESPLMLTLAFPSSAIDDPSADPRMEVIAARYEDKLLSPTFQAEWARRRLPMLIAKNAVQVVVWSQLSDSGPHAFPNAGLYDRNKAQKPIVDVMSDLRKRLLS
ncbi:endo-1,4-beta-xylanase [Botrimarina colliarenosi]|nr:endo-1,4-beta-xylanase [Botrimarina colliarenosi]